MESPSLSISLSPTPSLTSSSSLSWDETQPHPSVSQWAKPPMMTSPSPLPAPHPLSPPPPTSPLPPLPSSGLKPASFPRRAFLRRLLWSARTGLTVLAAGSMASTESIRQVTVAPFLIPVFAIIVSGPSLASSLRLGVLGVGGTLVGAVVALVSQGCGLALAHSLMDGRPGSCAHVEGNPPNLWLQLPLFALSLLAATFLIRNTYVALVSLVGIIALSLGWMTDSCVVPFDALNAAKLVASISMGAVVGVLVSIPLPTSDALRLNDTLHAMTHTVGYLTDALISIHLTRSDKKTRFQAEVARERVRSLFSLFESQAGLARSLHGSLAWDPHIFLKPRSGAIIDAYSRLLDDFHSLHTSLRCLQATAMADVAKDAYVEAFRPYIQLPLLSLASQLRTFATSLPLVWARSSLASGFLSELSAWTSDAPIQHPDASPLIEAMATARQELFYSGDEFDASLPSLKDMINLQVMSRSLAIVAQRMSDLGSSFSPPPPSSQSSPSDAFGEEDEEEEENGSSTRETRGLLTRLFWSVVGVSPVRPRLVFALRRSVGILLASLVVLVPALSDIFGSNGVWAPLSVAFVMTSNELGTSLKRAVLRLEGTVAGAMIAYVTLVLVGAYTPLVVIIIAVWVTLSGLVRASKEWSYAGLVSAFTAALIAFGNENPDVSSEEYALQRVKQTFVGILVSTLVSVVFPGRWIGTRLYISLHDTLGAVIPVIDAVLHQGETREDEMEEKNMESMMGEVWKGVKMQEVLNERSTAEPTLWRFPVPNRAWSIVVREERKLVHSLIWMEHLTAVGFGGVGVGPGGRTQYLAKLSAQIDAVRDVFVQCLQKLVRDIELATSRHKGIDFDAETARITTFLAQVPTKLAEIYDESLRAHVLVAHSRSTIRAELDTPLVSRLSATIWSITQVSHRLRKLWHALLDLEYEQRINGSAN